MIIMALVVLLFLLKLTFLSRWGQLATAIVAGAFVVMSYSSAITQSRTRIAQWLQMPSLMLDTSVLLTVDVAFQICFCMLAASTVGRTLPPRERVALAVCRWVPGIMIFPVLYSLLVEVVFAMPGADFATLGWSVAAAVALATPLLARLVEFAVPERELRLELIYLVGALTLALGIVATVNGRTAAAGTNAVEWSALGAVMALALAGTLAGAVIYRIKAKKSKI